ncbi:GNAT family N-acetyltransferase [Pelomonas sp. V22]|uniref:GNAT family N-acetyltransferase n=1 Tax=Pelomonas sp. V22 TaxID=2822139 RepID=UPI0024A80D78|nr:GNAT family N-acetyltransferase [Pelomonas sp. V22]MDI4631456.1 GNAT family N-acetyltransferase [Pelomonas sp. V22]
MTTLHTARLRLEPCCQDHLQGLHRLNSDPLVMRYITGKPDTLEDTQSMIDRVQARWADWGYSWWSFFDRESGELIGAGCIQHLDRDASQPHEIGWRLQRSQWGKGLASEAAERMTSFAFDTLEAPQLTAICAPDNLASSRVMERLGMAYRGLERWYERDWATYAISAGQWRERAARLASYSPPTK